MTRLFRKQLLIAILPVLILAALSTLVTTRISEQHIVEQLKDELIGESQLHTANARAFFDVRIAELQAIAATPVMLSGNRPEIIDFLASHERRLAGIAEGLYYTVADGTVYPTNGESFNIRDREYFDRLFGGEVIISDELASRATRRNIVLIGVPVFDQDGKQVASLCESILVTTLIEHVDTIYPDDVGFAALVDSNGNILTRSRPPIEREGQFRQWLQQQFAEARAGNEPANPVIVQATFGAEEYFVVRRPIPQTGWALILAKRTNLATEPALRTRWTNLVFSGLVLVIAFLIAYYFTGRLLGPFAQLVDAHRRFGHGDWQARLVDLPNDELGELGQAFNRMAEQLEERQAAQRQAERQLRESEARLRLISDNVDDAIFLHDADGRILDANPMACSSLGYSCEELLQKNLTEIIAGHSPEEILRVWRSTVARDEKTLVESHHRRQDGTTFPVEISLVPLHTTQGVRILASARDISERRAAEDKMAKFFRLSEDMMCIVDSQGIFRQLSPAFEQVLGHPLNEMLGQPYLNFVHPEDRERTRIEGERVLRGDGSVNFENRYRCRDGSYKWLQWRPFREVDEGMVYAIARDVTESYRLTRIMSQTSEAASIGGWELDFVTGELYWTEETYRLHETTPEEYKPQLDSAINFYAPESQPIIREAIERGKRDGTPWNLELQLITAKGRRIWANAIGRVDVENGRPIRAYGSFQDITERKAAEEERRKLDDHLREIQRIESIGILAGGIAHDFNNLLTGVLGFTRLAMAEAEDDSIRAHLAQIEQCSLRAADLCKQLLAYAGKGQFVIETLDISQLTRETATLVEAILGSEMTLKLELADDLPLIEGDATQLRQVLMNLMTNAFDALEGKPGQITARTGIRDFDESWLSNAVMRNDLRPGRHVFVEVSDTGVGMSQETIARIFDPFFTTKFAGRGLGLAAVLGIVRSHDGALHVDSTPGKGSTFTIILPLSEEPEADPANRPKRSETPPPATAQAAPQSAPAATATPAPNGAEATTEPSPTGTVLVIDDETAVLALARTALQKGGYDVLVASEGKTGLALFNEHRDRIVAVLVDITMPGMNGTDVLKQLRDADPNMPLIMMSGYSEHSLDGAADSLHLSGFVAKPFRVADLVATVSRAIANRS